MLARKVILRRSVRFALLDEAEAQFCNPTLSDSDTPELAPSGSFIYFLIFFNRRPTYLHYHSMTMNNEMGVKLILDIVMSDYLRKLYTFCLRETRNHADAEDLCQDILTEIVYSARSLRQPGALPGWVWTIARRTHSRWVKQREQAE